MQYFDIKVNWLYSHLKVRNNFKLSTFSVDKHGVSINIFKYFMGLIGWYFLVSPIDCYSRDFGVVSNTFAVKEAHFGDQMRQRAARLTPEQRAKIEKGMQKKAQEIINRPKGKKLPRASRYTRRVFDSSVRATDDIFDHEGNIIHPKGFKVDPFHSQYGVSVFLTRDWLFIDGDDAQQVAWASKLSGGLILINGSPVEISNQLDRYVYFDQFGSFVKRLDLRSLPARLSQVGGMGGELIIEEFVI